MPLRPTAIGLAPDNATCNIMPNTPQAWKDVALLTEVLPRVGGRVSLNAWNRRSAWTT